MAGPPAALSIPEVHAGAGGQADTARIAAAFAAADIVLVRGLGTDADAFEALTRGFCDHFHRPSRGRRGTGRDGLTFEVFSQNIALLGHSEATFMPLIERAPDGGRRMLPRPEVCFFVCCAAPADAGGETTLVDGVRFLEEMPAALRRRFEGSEITYSMRWTPERWQSEFAVVTAEELEALLRDVPGVSWTLRDGLLDLRYRAPATPRCRRGPAAFANGILAHLPAVTHAAYRGQNVHAVETNRVWLDDGTEVAGALADDLVDLHERLAHAHRWRPGDLLMIDNTRYLHGRRMTRGPGERALVSRFGWLRG